jgi:transposase
MELLLVNARHMKAVPGRKTDVKDAEWIADLLRHGLLRGSFVPEKPQRELRELTRYRRRVVQQRAQAINRIQKVLEGANVKLGNVASDIMGISGRAMLEALAAREDDPEKLASLAKGKLKSKRAELKQALAGTINEHQGFLLASLLRQVSFLNQEIATLDQEVTKRLGPFNHLLASLDTIPGVSAQVGEEILAEIGYRHEPLPNCQAPRLLGESLPREQPEWRQTNEW